MSGNMWASPDSFCPVYQGLHVAVSVFINFLEDAWVARRDTATAEYNSFSGGRLGRYVWQCTKSFSATPFALIPERSSSVRLGRGAAENALNKFMYIRTIRHVT